MSRDPALPIFARQTWDFARLRLAARPALASRRASPPSGFTLLEVLAAVAILGGLYIVLAGVAMQGLRAEGESQRRLEASLLADRQLSDLEIQLDAGSLPALGRTETQQEPFQVVLEVQPFEMPRPEERAEDSGDAEYPSPEDDPGAPALEGLLAIELTVTWLEGVEERSVERTTYALDLAAAGGLLGGAAEGDEGR